MINKYAQESALFSIGSEILKQVDEYRYLGEVATVDPNNDIEIRRRIGMGWGAYGKNSQIMKTKLSLSLKGEVFTQCVLPVMTFCPIWGLNGLLYWRTAIIRGYDDVLVVY